MAMVPKAIHLSPDNQAQPLARIYLEFAQFLRTLHRSEDTITQRIGDIRRFAGDSDPLIATPEQLGHYLHTNRNVWRPEYRRKIRSSFVIFYQWATSSGRIQFDPTLNLASIRPGLSPRSPIPEDTLLEGFYEAPLETQAVIALAAAVGLRRTEIALLHTRDRSGRNITVHGKGGKVRVIPLSPLAYDLLRDLEDRNGPGYYFRNQRTGHHLHPSTIYKHAKRYIGEWCLHSLRHRTATKGLRLGANLRGLQALLGHASLSTTQIYTEVTIEDLERITNSLDWPRIAGESAGRSSVLTIDLDNLAPQEVPLLADALSRYLSGLQAA